jgi:3-phenylpropionate/trans-cinnamate dioxygenase ferredoxin reductase subunit
VTAVDPDRSQVTLDDTRNLGYERLLLTTGAKPRRLSIPGAELDGIYYLRAISDCDTLRERLDAKAKVAVIGAGWIGAECAASAAQLGAHVTMIDPASVPLERVLGAEVGGFYRDVHVDHGVEVLLGTGMEGFDGDGSVRRVRTSDGRAIDCDFAIVGIGVVPRVELADGARLETDNGILVDQRLATSVPHTYAAGDVANAWHPFYDRRVRVEHWANALNQGPAAARAMLGLDVAYDRIPYFFSDQCDIGMEYSGFATEWDQVVFRGNPSDREFIAFWLREGRVVAGMNVNIWDVNEQLQALIRSHRPVDAATLIDPDTPLESLLADDGAELGEVAL